MHAIFDPFERGKWIEGHLLDVGKIVGNVE
jgi:hypothetical protein